MAEGAASGKNDKAEDETGEMEVHDSGGSDGGDNDDGDDE